MALCRSERKQGISSLTAALWLSPILGCERSRNTLITTLHPDPKNPGLVGTQENTEIQLSSAKAAVEVALGGKRNLSPPEVFGTVSSKGHSSAGL